MLKHYLNPDNEVDVLMGESSFEKLSREFFKSNIKVRKYIKISNESERQGIHSIEQRIRSTKDSVKFLTENLNV